MAAVAGCGQTTRAYINPNADISAIKKVAVLPFENLTQDQFAAFKVYDAFVTELLIARYFDAVEPGEIDKAIRDLGPDANIRAGRIDVAAAQKLGKALNVQAVVLGTVEHYEMGRFGGDEYPVVSVTVRLLDVEAGVIIWMATRSEKGGPGFPFVSVGEIHILSRLSQKVCKEIVESLGRVR
jgi:TolB-like protein